MAIDFVSHNSLYLGGDYYRHESKVGEFILQANWNDFEREWSEEDFCETNVLLYVNEPLKHQDIEEKLLAIKGVKILRKEVVGKKDAGSALR